MAVQRGFLGVREDGVALRYQCECEAVWTVDFSKCRSKVKLSNCVWSQDDQHVVTSSWLKRIEKKKTVFDVDIKVWNAQTGTIEFVLNRDETPVITGPISSMYLHPEFPSILVTSCWSGNLCFWDLESHSLLHKLILFSSKSNRRISNTHFAGHSNRYFLNDPVPILDFRFTRGSQHILAVDDDGSLLMSRFEMGPNS